MSGIWSSLIGALPTLPSLNSEVDTPPNTKSRIQGNLLRVKRLILTSIIILGLKNVINIYKL